MRGARPMDCEDGLPCGASAYTPAVADAKTITREERVVRVQSHPSSMLKVDPTSDARIVQLEEERIRKMLLDNGINTSSPGSPVSMDSPDTPGSSESAGSPESSGIQGSSNSGSPGSAGSPDSPGSPESNGDHGGPALVLLEAKSDQEGSKADPTESEDDDAAGDAGMDHRALDSSAVDLMDEIEQLKKPIKTAADQADKTLVHAKSWAHSPEEMARHFTAMDKASVAAKDYLKQEHVKVEAAVSEPPGIALQSEPA